MRKIEKMLEFYSKIKTNNMISDEYVRDELLRGIRLTLIKVLKGSGIQVKEEITLQECTKLVHQSKINISNVLPLTICNDYYNNTQLLGILRACFICADKYTVENKELIMTSNECKFYANENYILATKLNKPSIIFIGYRKDKNFQAIMLDNLQSRLGMGVYDSNNTSHNLLERLKGI